MNKFVKKYTLPIIILGVFGVLIIYTVIGNILATNKSSSSEQTELTEHLRTIELHFGNGEIYKAEAELVVPAHGAPIAILENDRMWRFEEAYKYEYNRDTKTYKVFLWRNEPYDLEKEYFEKIN